MSFSSVEWETDEELARCWIVGQCDGARKTNVKPPVRPGAANSKTSPIFIIERRKNAFSSSGKESYEKNYV